MKKLFTITIAIMISASNVLAAEGDIMSRLFCKLYENDDDAEVDKINHWLMHYKF